MTLTPSSRNSSPKKPGSAPCGPGDASFTHKDNPDIAFIIPKEGAVIWADTFAIPKGAKHKELAEAFINYLYDPQVSAKNYEYIGYNDPNAKAETYHSEEYKQIPC